MSNIIESIAQAAGRTISVEYRPHTGEWEAHYAGGQITAMGVTMEEALDLLLDAMIDEEKKRGEELDRERQELNDRMKAWQKARIGM